MIGDCDCCDRTGIPVSKVNVPGEPIACFICQGDTDPDPYGEKPMEDEIRKMVEQIKCDVIEACAKVAEHQYHEFEAGRGDPTGEQETGWHFACTAIAEAIRKMASPASSEEARHG